MTPDALPPEVLAELDKLRDIRLPDPAGWWPPAPGWWALLAIGLALLAAAAFTLRRRRASLRFAALAELRALEARAESRADPHSVAVDLAVLLRRVALSRDGTRAFASLSDTAWARTLTQGENAFAPDVAAFLGEAPYAPANDDTAPRLDRALAQSGRWIRSHT